MQEQTVTAILVTYNSEDIIASCLSCLQNEAHVSDIIVVDNASTDNTVDVITKKFSGVRLIKNKENKGFGRANNQALEKVKSPYALLINPDAKLKEGALKALVEAAIQYDDAAILAPILLDETGHPHKSYKQSVFNREQNKGTYKEPAGDLCAEFLSGAVWLVHMEHLRKVGFFDKEIFLYYEDDDLCLRARKDGFGLVLVADAKAEHAMGGSSGELTAKQIAFRQEHMAWSRLYIEQKYHNADAAKKMATRQQLEYAFKASLYLLLLKRKKVAKCRARIKGIFNFTEGLKPGQSYRRRQG